MKNFSNICLLIALLVSFNPVYAYDFEVDGIYYDVISTSELTCKVVYGDQKYSGDIVIPAKVSYSNRTLKVTEIGNSAFSRSSALTSIKIPNSVMTIGSLAFAACSALTDIEIPNSVMTIGVRAFSGCSELKNIKLSDNLIQIKYGTFKDCKSLESIVFPGSIENIEQYIYTTNSYPATSYYTFDNCSKLKIIRFQYHPSKLDFGYYYFDYPTKEEFYKNYPLEWTNTVETIFIDRETATISYLKSLKEIIIGENLKNLSIELNLADNLTSITSYAIDPPIISVCKHSQYMNTKVRVPNEALDAYRRAEGWKEFWDIEGFETSDVDDIQTETDRVEIGRYNLLGSPVSEDYDGIVIIRYSDGSTRKVINK